jgi:hypothetical protein
LAGAYTEARGQIRLAQVKVGDSNVRATESKLGL